MKRFKVQARFSDVYIEAENEQEARIFTGILEKGIRKTLYSVTGTQPHPDSVQLEAIQE